MRILIVSDIHGNYDDFLKVIKMEAFDRLVVLGDLLSYSNNYDDEDEENILNILSKYKNKLVLIKGNCDYFINYDAYDLFAHDEISLTLNNHVTTFTHGHIYNKGFLPKYHGDIFICGHSHVPLLIKENDIIYANPGSIGKPRGGSSKSYLIFEDNKLIIKDLNQNTIKELII